MGNATNSAIAAKNNYLSYAEALSNLEQESEGVRVKAIYE